MKDKLIELVKMVNTISLDHMHILFTKHGKDRIRDKQRERERERGERERERERERRERERDRERYSILSSRGTESGF